MVFCNMAVCGLQAFAPDLSYKHFVNSVKRLDISEVKASGKQLTFCTSLPWRSSQRKWPRRAAWSAWKEGTMSYQFSKQFSYPSLPPVFSANKEKNYTGSEKPLPTSMKEKEPLWSRLHKTPSAIHQSPTHSNNC
jgi:hypothetical protein